MSLHSAIASARLQSNIAADSACWSWLSQGLATPLSQRLPGVEQGNKTASVLASVESMMPLHSAIASARLQSNIVADSACWSWLSQLTACMKRIYLISISGLLQALFLDTAAGVWCDTKSVVTSPRTGRYSVDAAGGDAAVELTRRCRPAAAAVGDLIYIYGGLHGEGHVCLELKK